MSSSLLRPAILLTALLAMAQASFAADPKVPPAEDPGAVPVALVTAGIDYTDAAIAPRLARDGEGNIVGWDFVDNDIFPFSKDAAANAQAKLLLAMPGVELVPVRVAAGNMDDLARAIAFSAQTPARILVLTVSSGKKEEWELFAKAAQHFKGLLIIAALAETAPSYPAALNLDNVLSIARPQGKAETANAVFAGPAEPATNADAAIALAAALATCHAAAIGEGDGKARKAVILSKLAKPRSSSKIAEIPACP